MVTRPLNPSSTQPTAATNKGAVVAAYLRGIQATLAGELESYQISC